MRKPKIDLFDMFVKEETKIRCRIMYSQQGHRPNIMGKAAMVSVIDLQNITFVKPEEKAD